MNSYSNTDDGSSATWPDFSTIRGSTFTDLASALSYFSTSGAYVPDPNATENAAINAHDPWSMPGPSVFDGCSSVSYTVSDPWLVGGTDWTVVDPLAANAVATTPDSGVSPSSTTATQDGWPWPFNPLESPNTTPASSPEYGGEAGRVAPDHGANPPEVTTSRTGYASGLSWPIPAVPGDVTATFAPAAAFRKRRHEAEQPGDGGKMSHHKRARGSETAEGIPKAARSAARTRHKPATRIPEERTSDKPKEVGRGAEKLATPSSQGIYHQSSPGPSFRQGWSVGAADGMPTQVEGSVDEGAVHHTDSMVQQQNEKATGLFTIPRKFKQEHRMLLQISEADDARGAVQEIKCRLCPDAKLRDFEEFKRHCRTSEMHPRLIHFCDRCGDFFARIDALKRHCSLPPAECRKVTPAMAVEKRRVTGEEHERFVQEMTQVLTAGEGIGNLKGFSQIIKEKYPESSKKRTGGSK